MLKKCTLSIANIKLYYISAKNIIKYFLNMEKDLKHASFSGVINSKSV